MSNITDTLFHVYERRDTSKWEYEPAISRPIYGVYHVYCVEGWQRLVTRQVENLKHDGLLDATKTLFVSCISKNNDDVNELKRIIDSPNIEIISFTNDAHRYEYPALEKVLSLCREEDCLVYYFHTKGISYQCVDTNDRLFQGFQAKIDAWREMLEYFVFTKWHVAVNTLSNGYDLYGCYRWPPRDYKMFSGNFWWINSDYGSPFESIADLYFVRMRRSIYASNKPKISDTIPFVFTYNWRKFLKHAFGYSYKVRCQKRFQQLNVFVKPNK